MRAKGMLIIISGPSGSGKGTVIRSLDALDDFSLSVSLTTRMKRPGEVDGVDYFFCTKEEFVRRRDNNELLEHIQYCNNYYGTPRSYVESRIAEGKAVILEIEVIGALQVKEKFKDAVLIFLLPPTRSDLKKRLTLRGTEDPEVIEERLRRADEEVKLIEKYDYMVINDDIERAVSRINMIMQAEFLRPKRNAGFIDRFKER